MSVGNLKDYGNKGNNFPYQLAVLKLLDGILTAVATAAGDRELRITPYKANKNGVGYSTNDFISRTDIVNAATGAIISTLWFNETTGLTIAAPPQVDLDPYIPPSSVTVTNLASVTRTPSYIQANAAGVVAAGARSVTVYNSGTTAGVWLGTPIQPGVTLSFSAGGQADVLGAFAYTASATATLEITTVV
jgi:hypothetical protein